MKLFYIVKSEMLTGGVIEAQVVASLRAQSRLPEHPAARLMFLEPAGVAMSQAARATLQRFRAMWPEGRMRIVPYVGRLGNNAPGRALALALAHERFTKDALVFHCRAPEAALQAREACRWLGRGRVVFDLRGAGPYEAIHANGHAWADELPPEIQKIYDLNLARDRRAASVADFVLTVSPGLENYASEQLSITADKLALVPSCVNGLGYSDEARQAARAVWGVKGDAPVLLYAGQLAADRLPGHLFGLFAALWRKRHDAKLVILSYLNRLDDWRGILSRLGAPETSVHAVARTRDETLQLLPGADVAALFLEPALRYRHCFPVKIPEYLSAGLPLAVNDAWEWIPELARQQGLGWILPTAAEETDFARAADKIIEDLSLKREELRRRALAVCEERFVWPRYREELRRAYGLADKDI
jgi:glycosyltransferase involved in cell wall biosynthesis